MYVMAINNNIHDQSEMCYPVPIIQRQRVESHKSFCLWLVQFVYEFAP